MIDYGEYDKMMKISGNMDKSDTYKGFRCLICLPFDLFLHTHTHTHIYMYI